MATIGQGGPHPIQAQLDAAAGEGLQQVVQIDGGRQGYRGYGR